MSTAIPTRSQMLYKYERKGEEDTYGSTTVYGRGGCGPVYDMKYFTGTEGDFIREYAKGWTTTKPEDYAG